MLRKAVGKGSGVFMFSRALSSSTSAFSRGTPHAQPMENLVDQTRMPREDIDWDCISFDDRHLGRYLYKSTYVLGKTESWKGQLEEFGPLLLQPTAQVLNYGQSIFEGLKAYRSANGGINLFRPGENAARMSRGARRMMMPEVPEDVFLRAVRETAKANADLVPPTGKGALYLRPLLLGTGGVLGVRPSTEYTFLVYCGAVGPYFKGGKLTPIHLKVSEDAFRAARGGTGSTKCAGNYAPCMLHTAAAREEGYSDVVYLDAANGTFLEEVSASNVFAVKDGTVWTPPLTGTILQGVTRGSVVQIARDLGYKVREETLSIDLALECDEIFTTGTAVVIAPVGSLSYQGERHIINSGRAGPVTAQLYRSLFDLQHGAAEDTHGWLVPVC